MRARFAPLIASFLAAAACDSSQIQTCEAKLKDGLKSPASYKRVSVETNQIPPNVHKPPYDEVKIKYDAANSYNALLRDEMDCFYRPGTTESFEPFADEEANELNALANQAAMDAANAQADAAPVEDAEPENSSVETYPHDTCMANAATSEDFSNCTNGQNVDN
jgi:hypothetical protein